MYVYMKRGACGVNVFVVNYLCKNSWSLGEEVEILEICPKKFLKGGDEK